MLNLLRLLLLCLLIYVFAVLYDPTIASYVLPSMHHYRYEVGGWILLSRDKVGHFFLIGGAALTLNFFLKAKSFQIGHFSFLWGSAIIGLLVILEELRQIPIVARHFELLDIFYSFAGIFILGRIGAWLYKKFI